MRLLVIEPGLKLWGSERAFLETVPALTAAWERVVVMLPHGAELATELPSEIQVLAEPIGHLHRGGVVARARAVVAIARACVRHRIDAIYLNQAGMCRLVHLVARALGIATIVHVRIVEDVKRCRALVGTRRAPVSLIMISRSMAAHYPGGGEAERWKTVRMAYDPYEMPGEPAATGTRSRDFACVGRLAAIKGQLELVEAVGTIDESRRPHVDLIGAAAAGDAYGDRVGARRAELALDAHVGMLGYRTDALELMENYRFVVVPSHYEPLGRVIFEAWSAGAMPICSADSGGAAEVIEASGGGLTYAGHAPAGIGAALARAAAMGEAERWAAVERGRTWVRENLSIDAYRDALRDVLFPQIPGACLRGPAAPAPCARQN